MYCPLRRYEDLPQARVNRETWSPFEGRREMGLSDRASFLRTQAAVLSGLRLTFLGESGYRAGGALCSEVSVGVVNGRVT